MNLPIILFENINFPNIEDVEMNDDTRFTESLSQRGFTYSIQNKKYLFRKTQNYSPILSKL